MTALCLHAGAVRVGREELARYEAPPPTATWFPVCHTKVLDTAIERLSEAGYQTRKTDLAVSKDGHRFFGTLDLEAPLAPGVSLAVGLRNSTDQTFPLGFCAGSRVFVCDNLAFRSELLVKRKHTRFGEVRFNNAITQAVTSLRSFQEVETKRVELMQCETVCEDRAFALILKAHLRQIVAHRHLEGIARQWHEPAYDWGGKTLFRLFNAMTYVLADVAQKNPSDYATRTMQLNSLLCPVLDTDVSHALAV